MQFFSQSVKEVLKVLTLTSILSLIHNIISHLPYNLSYQ
jgi:hypothetical protein